MKLIFPLAALAALSIVGATAMAAQTAAPDCNTPVFKQFVGTDTFSRASISDAVARAHEQAVVSNVAGSANILASLLPGADQDQGLHAKDIGQPAAPTTGHSARLGGTGSAQALGATADKKIAGSGIANALN